MRAVRVQGGRRRARTHDNNNNNDTKRRAGQRNAFLEIPVGGPRDAASAYIPYEKHACAYDVCARAGRPAARARVLPSGR